jgi:methyl-accepting chemotaxis protein
MPRREEVDVRQLQEQVDNLARVVGVLSTAVDRMSQSQAIVSDTVNNLVQAQEQFTEVQEQLVKALYDNNSNLTEISENIGEVLKRLPPSE